MPNRISAGGKRDPDSRLKDQAEEEWAAYLAGMFSEQYDSLVDQLDPNNPQPPPPSFWDEWGATIASYLALSLFDLAQASSQSAIERIGIGANWDAVLNASQEWASRYSFSLVRDINATSQAALQKLLSDYYGGRLDYDGMLAMLESRFGPTRAASIAATEVTRGFEQGIDIYQQELDGLGLETDRVWITEAGACPICSPYDGVLESEGWAEGEPPLHTNCLPGDTLVLPVGEVAAGSKRWFEGDVARIVTSKYNLTATPNHPILTERGWVAAGKIKQGDKVWCYRPSEWERLLVDADNENVITPIKDVFSSLGVSGFRVPVSAPDFHGDGANSEVAIIRTNSKVMPAADPFIAQPLGKNALVLTGVGEAPVFGQSSTAQLVEVGLAPADGGVSSGNLLSALSLAHSAPPQEFGLRLTPGLNPSLDEVSSDNLARYSSHLRHAKFGLPSKIELQEVVEVDNSNFSGHVYNLQSESEVYVASGIITHNCRCRTEIVILPGSKHYAQWKARQ